MTIGYATYEAPTTGERASISLAKKRLNYVVRLKRNRHIEEYEQVTSEQEGQYLAAQWQARVLGDYGMQRVS